MAHRTPVSIQANAEDDVPRLLTVDQARRLIVAACTPRETIRLPIDDALGLVLVADVIAGDNLPPFANAAMDGFAVRAADTVGASLDTPVALPVIGEAGAGRPAAVSVAPGCAVRIMTGAPIPDGADAVVRFEDTDEGARPLGQTGAGGQIGIIRVARLGDHVRPAGEDVEAGVMVLPRGTCLQPADIGLLAALNHTHAVVHQRPRVAILATGDELVAPGQELGPGQIRDCNTPMLAAMVRRCGGEPVLLGVARDTAADLRAKLRAGHGVDLLITTGGVSVGDYDVVKDVLRLEGRIDLWQVRMKPGKPLAFGMLHGVPLLGLPGNPMAAAVAFEQFARPAIRAMLGHRALTRPAVRARLAGRVANQGGRRQFVPVRVEAARDGLVANLIDQGGRTSLAALARANGLLVIPEEMVEAAPGDALEVQMLAEEQ